MDQIAPIKGLNILSKFLVVLYAMIVMTAIQIVRLFAGTYNADTVVAMVNTYVYFFCGPFIALCLVSLVWGAIQIWRGYRFTVGLSVFILGFLIYRMALGIVFHGELYHEYSWIISYLSVSLVIGGMFCLTGVYLYNRFADI